MNVKGTGKTSSNEKMSNEVVKKLDSNKLNEGHFRDSSEVY